MPPTKVPTLIEMSWLGTPGPVAGEGEHGRGGDEQLDAAAERHQRGRPDQDRDVDRGVGAEGGVGPAVDEGVDRVDALGQRRAGGQADLLAGDRGGLRLRGRDGQEARDGGEACDDRGA